MGCAFGWVSCVAPKGVWVLHLVGSPVWVLHLAGSPLWLLKVGVAFVWVYCVAPKGGYCVSVGQGARLLLCSTHIWAVYVSW